MKWFKHTAFILLIVMICFKSFHMPSDFDRSFAQLPVMHDGRVKPLDTVARHYLLQIQGTLSLDEYSPTEWFFHIITDSNALIDLPIILVEHPLLFASIDQRYNKQKFRVSESFLDQNIAIIHPFIKEALELEKEQRSPFLQAVYLVYFRYQLIKDLRASFFPFLHQLPGFESFDGSNSQFSFWNQLITQSQDLTETTDFDSKEFLTFSALFRNLSDHTQLANQLNLIFYDDQWMSLSSFALSTQYHVSEKSQLVQFLKLSSSDLFHQREIVSNLIQNNDYLNQSSFDRFQLKLEYYFNILNPFIVSLFLYLTIIILSFIGAFFSYKLSYHHIFWCWVTALSFHGFGLLARFLILMRPPVINLYSSAIFIAFVASFIGFIIFKKTRKLFFSGYISTLSCLSLIVAYHLSLSGDTLEVMEAVLNSNFWLSTHVVAMTIGYAIIFMAGFLSIAYILMGTLSRKLTKDLDASLSRMVYIFLMISLFFNLLGTVLGGIWADQSWGRFWGWDPKENGAILIVLWTAIILHMKWGKLIRSRGLMILTVLSNIVTAWSWKGTNMLGIGLHSYGFTEQTFYWLIVFFMTQIIVVCLGLLPERFWLSFNKQ